MYQFNFLRKIFYLIFTFIIFSFVILLYKNDKVYAMEASFYSYDEIHEQLPVQYKNDEFLYQLTSVPYISFATYNHSGDYKTSVKRTAGKDDFLYCMDYSKIVIFDKELSEYNSMFDSRLRSRIGIVLHYGTNKWNTLAHSQFTTGNSILDYYMTQIVIHAIIHKFDSKNLEHGIDYNLLTFKKNTDILKSKTDAFYNFCCNVNINLPSGYFQNVDFSFQPIGDKNLYLEDDKLVTPWISCKSKLYHTTVKEYIRSVNGNKNLSNQMQIETKNNQYDSTFRIKIPIHLIDQNSIGKHMINIREELKFDNNIACFWNYTDSELSKTKQELGGLKLGVKNIEDSIDFEYIVGSVQLHKSDRITGEIIKDAEFQLFQFDDQLQDFVYYKNLTYDPNKRLYEANPIFISSNNKNGLFRVIESKSGYNYINDWKGKTFNITKDKFSHEIYVENQPILGKLKIKKSGENLIYNNEFEIKECIPLQGIQFTLYAKDDIYLKDKVFYKKNEKIIDLYTDEKGEYTVDHLLPGKYYIKEKKTSPQYKMDNQIYEFQILKNAKNTYNEVELHFTNQLKKHEISILKYNESNKNKHYLENAIFGLYAAEDIYSTDGSCLLKKDTLISKERTDKDGRIDFEYLPYADYYIKEIEAPDGYKKNNLIIKIPKNQYIFNQKKNRYQYQVEVENDKILYDIQIKKSGEFISSYQYSNNSIGEFILYEYDEKPLANVRFSLYDNKKHFLYTEETNQDGILSFKNLEPGTYYYKEETTPNRYKIDAKLHKIIIVSKKNNKDETSKIEEDKNPVLDRNIQNELCACTLSIQKYGEKLITNNDNFRMNKIPLKNVLFGIYQNFDYQLPSGKIIPKDSCIGYMVTNEEGKSEFKGKIPIGNYYIKELKAPSGYKIDLKKYFFEAIPNNKDYKITLENDNCFYNHVSKGEVVIYKRDYDTNKPLKNVEFTLYNEENDKLGVYKTDYNGKISVKDLPYGKYHFVETKCLNGYYSSNNKYKFTIEAEKPVVLNIENHPILKLGFEERYKVSLIGVFLVIIFFISFNLRIFDKFFDRKQK